MTDAHFLSIAERWQGRFDGRLWTREHEHYGAARRIWNGMIDRRPGLIARCASAWDEEQAVKLAQSEGLPLSVRGGGHSVAGTAVCADGLMVDLSPSRRMLV